jgi:hypothetical protein
MPIEFPLRRVLKRKVRFVYARERRASALVGHLSPGCIKCAHGAGLRLGAKQSAGRKPSVELREKRWQPALLNVIAAVDARA